MCYFMNFNQIKIGVYLLGLKYTISRKGTYTKKLSWLVPRSPPDDRLHPLVHSLLPLRNPRLSTGGRLDPQPT